MIRLLFLKGATGGAIEQNFSKLAKTHSQRDIKITSQNSAILRGYLLVWRGLRDLNSRAGFPTYSLSRGLLYNVK